MIDVLGQHGRERRLAVILFVVVVAILTLVQWRVNTVSVDVVKLVTEESL